MNENHLTWNVTNWVTVFLMFLSAWIIVSLGIAFVKGRKTQKAA
jgi:hypothetical protein